MPAVDEIATTRPERWARMTGRSEERRVGKECRSLCDWSSDVCSSDLVALDRGLRGVELVAHDAGGRRDRDDEAGALGAHDRKYRAGDIHRAEQGSLDLPPEVLRADLLEEPGVEVARVVDENVDPAEALDGRLHRRLGVRGAGDVQLDD